MTKFVHFLYPLVYRISLSDHNVASTVKVMGLEYESVSSHREMLCEIAKNDGSNIIFTGQSFYNVSLRAPPYIIDERNVFDIFGVIPFGIIDDHAYADFMLQRCKKAPKEVVMGSSSPSLLNEFDAVSISEKVHKITIPPKSPEIDLVPFKDKQERAVFIGKLYENVPSSKQDLERHMIPRLVSDERVDRAEKELIFDFVKGRLQDPFFSPVKDSLKGSNLALLYLDSFDKFFRNFYRERELNQIVGVFAERKIPTYVIGGSGETWSFSNKLSCTFMTKKRYEEAMRFLHHSKYCINATPSYGDMLTNRAIDMMGSNSLCISDYSPFYENLEKSAFYFGPDYLMSHHFESCSKEEDAQMQKQYINKWYSEERACSHWQHAIDQARVIISRP